MSDSNNQYDRPQKKFLEDMYDDFFWLISSDPDAFNAAKEKIKKLRYNHEHRDTFDNIKSRKEYLQRANSRHSDKRKEATSYFKEDEPMDQHLDQPTLDYKKIKDDALK